MINGFPRSQAALPGPPRPLTSVLLPLRPSRARAQGGFVEAVIYEVLLQEGLYVQGWHRGHQGCPGGPASLGWAARHPAQGQQPGALAAMPGSELRGRHPSWRSFPAPGTPWRTRAPGCLLGTSRQPGLVRGWTLPCGTWTTSGSALEAQGTGAWGGEGTLVAALPPGASCPLPAPPRVDPAPGKLWRGLCPARPTPPTSESLTPPPGPKLSGPGFISSRSQSQDSPRPPSRKLSRPLRPRVTPRAGLCRPAEAKAPDALIPVLEGTAQGGHTLPAPAAVQ